MTLGWNMWVLKRKNWVWAFDVIFTKCEKDEGVCVCVCVCVCVWNGPGYVTLTRCCEQGNETTDAMQ